MKHVNCATVQRDLVECDEQFLHPKFSTAVSLAYFVAKREIMDTISRNNSSSKGLLGGLLKKIKDSEIFGD